ncbi:MAG: zinc-dependent peptidase [Hymenobacteraceae bacterium]|nr:zinc-dependent peptidase [Hymenobacteraceae bacterium]
MTTAQLVFLLAVVALFAGLGWWFSRLKRRVVAAVTEAFPAAWRAELERRVAFYRALAPTDRRRFEARMQLFLARTAVTGVQTEVDDVTRVLVAASAVIPIWGFPDWEYPNLREVLIVPDIWTEKADAQREFAGLQGTLLGSVQGFQGDQYMRLSKTALERGFRDWQNGENVGLHEFAHILDHADGGIDGTPGLALPAELRGAWTDVVKRELARVQRGAGILNPYAGTNEAELFAVAVESFFEEPDKLAQHHPELYELLTKALQQQPAVAPPFPLLSRIVRRGGGRRG